MEIEWQKQANRNEKCGIKYIVVSFYPHPPEDKFNNCQ